MNFDLQKFFPVPVVQGAVSESYEKRRPEILKGAQSFLKHYESVIKDSHRAGAGGRDIVHQTTALADHLIRHLYVEAAADLHNRGPQDSALIALGGYGRGHLNPRSDIDIMFYYSWRGREFSEKVAERILYLMWDLGLDVGYSVRGGRDCLEMAEKDITARTALLDSRFITGNEATFQEYEKQVLNKVLNWNSRKYLLEKIEENKNRLKKYGASIYMLEPNIKEGEGGLRDLHTGLWMAQIKFKARSLGELVLKGVLTEKESLEFEQAFDYLWRIRNELHYLSNGKNEQLRFDQQEKIAQFLGYRDNRKALAVEQFMQDYYAHANHVELISSRLMAKATQDLQVHAGLAVHASRRPIRRMVGDGFFLYGGKLHADSNAIFEENPSLMMRAFLLAQEYRVDLALHLKTLIRNSLHLINDGVRRSRGMVDDFKAILRHTESVEASLRLMHHLKFLSHFIPEFGRIYCKVQHDAYHVYTIDMHTLLAIGEMVRLWKGDYGDIHPVLTRVARDIEKRELLILAILLHDIGKGEGHDHANKGADMVPTIARRLGLNREDSQRLQFLVRHHLKMAHISQRRDMHDETLIVQFARLMGMSENLKMLYLLTFADIKAVGPDVWTAWKGMLLRELYETIYDILERGDFKLEKRSEKVRNRKRRVVELLSEELGERVVKERLRMMSTRYLFAHRSDAIAEHIRMISRLRGETLCFKVENAVEEGYAELTVVTLDMPALFSMITGVLTAFAINILGARIYTQNDGVALDILQVCGPPGQPLIAEEKWEKVREHMAAVLEGRMMVDELVRKRHRPAWLPTLERPKVPSRVEVDNEISEKYTVVDIFTHDKVGLLYAITRTLSQMGYYIGVSRISTKVDQVADTFYIHDIFGYKIHDEDKIKELREKLLEAIETC
ncbi:MAG: [protein-PII] uridylyltransferase [Syntrophotaleaceae bacterium]